MSTIDDMVADLAKLDERMNDQENDITAATVAVREATARVTQATLSIDTINTAMVSRDPTADKAHHGGPASRSKSAARRRAARQLKARAHMCAGRYHSACGPNEGEGHDSE
jgi:hypothetical protein